MLNKLFLAILFVFLSILSTAQNDFESNFGLLKDSAGFTYMRSTQSSNSKIVDTLYAKDFFVYYPTDTSDWFWVLKACDEGGFIHKNSIQDILDLPVIEKYHLIDSIFQLEAIHYPLLLNGDSLQKQKALNFHEFKYAPTLTLFNAYILSEYDESLVRQFIDLLLLEKGSADEYPTWILGSIYLKYPDHIIQLIEEYDHYILYADLEFGFLNVTYEKTKVIENYNELKNKMDQFLKSH
ncbi:hypothetical protein SAMN05216474_0041 [Lishizhenia tianjinensis]|uniref:SH3 domain-containing protein n=1 Tax=Lishizhenia tianjinensis TaxID=477690 RepID=A0A1I6XAL0_9FLAO|nr:hypothetical protein [Lishizhenia tianjinensis]SFT35091.1 hypothetical protein SAMN05216474_0041 [Lishizhenia tianjinensis]